MSKLIELKDITKRDIDEFIKNNLVLDNMVVSKVIEK